MLKQKIMLQIVCIFSFIFLISSQAFAHERSCGSRVGLPDGVVCGDENPADSIQPAAYCALIGASYDQNGHIALQLSPSAPTYEATLGFVLAKQTPLSRIRWYTEAISGSDSAGYIAQLKAVINRMSNEKSKAVSFDNLDCVVIGPVKDMLISDAPGDGTYPKMDKFLENISSAIIFINNSIFMRSNSRKLKIFIADYPYSEKLLLGEAGQNMYQKNLAYVSAHVESRLNATIRALWWPAVELANGVGVVNVWANSEFVLRTEVHPCAAEVPHPCIGKETGMKNGEYLLTFPGAPASIHPNFATVCAAANRLTTAIYNSYNSQKPAYPAADDLCPRN